MGQVVDVMVNLRGHVDLPAYDIWPEARARGREKWTAASLVESMDAVGIDWAGVAASRVAHGVGGEEDPIHVDEVHKVISEEPQRLFGWAGINPLSTMDAMRYIDYALGDLGFRGVHCYPHYWGLPINDRKYYPIYAKCVEYGVPIAVEVGAGAPRTSTRVCGLPLYIDDIALDFPELKFCALHVGGIWSRESVAMAENHENVYLIADLHAPSTWDPALLGYLNGRSRFPADSKRKVMWGTDWPVQEFGASLDQLRNLELEDDVKTAVAGQNATELFGLPSRSTE